MPVRCLLVFTAACLIAAAPPVRRLAEPISTVTGTVTIAGAKIEYVATSGRLALKDKTGKASANVFFVAYTKKDSTRPIARPLTFCFNGGPGSSSVWLHMGAFGPRRVHLADDGRSAPQPVKLVENDCSLLDLTDMVFIDPVSTGFSRADNQNDAKLFHGVEEDVQSVGEFIRLYTVKYQRTQSPKYLAGESYGTTRAAGLSSYLQDRAGIKLAGILLISSVLDFQTISFGADNDLPYTLYLPTYTASAWYHKKLDRTTTGNLTRAIEESQRFAEGEYAQALRKGNRLSEVERQTLAKRLSLLTGLPEKSVLTANLRIDPSRFRRELLREAGMTIGRYDSRVTGTVRGGGGRGEGAGAGGARGAGAGGENGRGAGARGEGANRGDGARGGERPGERGGGRGGDRGDPSYTAIQDAFTKGMNVYLQDGLHYKSTLRYTILSGLRPWNYGQAGTNRYLNVAPRLRAAMQKNTSLRVFVANGYYDLATPFAATEFTLAHLGPREITDRVTMTYYEAGHMMYTNKESRLQLKAEIAKFMHARSDATSVTP